jgi:hypothetical protein
LFVLFSLCLTASAYIVERKETLNGHTYTIREDQPFYRVYHLPHYKVFRPTPDQLKAESEEHTTISMKKEPKFGHHHLPKGEKKDTANWPRALRPYLPCLDLVCACPLFRGRIMGDQCVLPSGKALKRAVRKELRTMTTEERAKFFYHLQEMKKSGLYNEIGMVHRRSGVHSGPSFFPWHREFAKRLELVYRTLNPDQGLPYWDSTLDNNLPEPKDSVIFSEHLMGEADAVGNVVVGQFHNWTTLDVSVIFSNCTKCATGKANLSTAIGAGRRWRILQ